MQDEAQLSTMADQVPDEKKTEYQAEIIVGPEWKVVNQCSFIVAPGSYINTNSDEDDWQAWEIKKDKWDLVSAGGKKEYV